AEHPLISVLELSVRFNFATTLTELAPQSGFGTCQDTAAHATRQYPSMSLRDIVYVKTRNGADVYESQSSRSSSARTLDDDVHLRDQRDRKDVWLVRKCGVHEHQTFADDSAAPRCSDGH